MITWLLGGSPGPAGSLQWMAPDWVVVVAAVAAVAALAVALPGARSWRARLGEASLWALALAGAVVALAKPVWVEEEGRTEPGRVAVLVDASSSMAVRETDGSRAEAADAILATLTGPRTEVFHFGQDLRVGPPGAYDLPGTDLEAALHSLGERFAGEELAGVVVISDGLDRGLLRRAFQRDEDPVPPMMPGPLTVFQVGASGAVKDLSVRFVDAGGYAYIHAPFRIRADLQGLGFEGQTVEASLLKDGAVVSTQPVTLDAQGHGQVAFEVRASEAGRFSYLIRVPDFEDDAVPANNSMPVVVRVVRDRIRVLQVAGSPSWDVKFLRRFLKGDPSVDLVSFFILRTVNDALHRWQDNELSLIKFPYDQLFSEDLSTFDLVVFQNFDHEPFFGGGAAQLLENLHAFVVEDGHALVMIGGDRSFSLGAYGKPLGPAGRARMSEMLPVEVAPRPVSPDETAFKPKLTEAGARHPITRLTGDQVENDAIWGRLHALDGTNLGVAARPDATVLLQHPTQKGTDGRPLPVLSVREVGRGRTMALTADTSWRWSLSEAAEGRGNQAYLRFWKGAMRWLVKDPTTARVTVDTRRENYGLGDEVRVVVQARDADFSPLVAGEVTVTFTSGSEREVVQATIEGEGEAVVAYTPERRGAYRVDAEVREGTARVGDASTVFAVTRRDPELDEVAPDAAYLAWLANRVGGTFYGAGDSGPILRDDSAGRPVFDRREVALWRSPLMALWIGLFAGLAWVVRRRAGLR